MTGRDRGGPGVDADHVGVGREDGVDEHVVDVLFGVGAAVGENDDPIVEVSRLPEGRKDDAGGGDACQYQGMDGTRAKDQVEVAPRERADSPLSDQDVAGLNLQGRVWCGAGTGLGEVVYGG